MRFGLFAIAMAACSSAPPPSQPTQPTPADAAVVEADAPAKPDIKLEATPYVFEFASATRNETWTMWFASGVAILDVAPVGGTKIQYQGSATEGATLVVDVQGPTAKLTLDCKRTTRELDPVCDPAAKPSKAKPKKVSIDALDCYVPNYAEPMPFGPVPGIVYVADGTCAGYRVRSP